MRELAVLGQLPPERSDAARNRRRILEAAARVVADGDLSLDEVARAARVGVGTVYRRFGDRAGLVHALLDEHERRFQEAFLHGPPPLGPGAPPAARIRAFLHAVVDRVAGHTRLLMLTEADPVGRYHRGHYPIWHLHLCTLLDRPDRQLLAHVLLAPLSAGLIGHLLADGLDTDRIKAGIDQLLPGITDEGGKTIVQVTQG
ncbi:TetR/AcrR family transcriptional regulator [Pseudonocardia acaciae]|uniref:TetR/AcrR family transcriptional regulator n=1 Tax=Pseudonocardia acaciae TaxID=551276 RepID=UPI0006847727|nr:TetR/AcrR family transcriptional regulator [Pseudonocardia acaciae]